MTGDFLSIILSLASDRLSVTNGGALNSYSKMLIGAKNPPCPAPSGLFGMVRWMDPMETQDGNPNR